MPLPPLVAPGPSLSFSQVARYSRHLLIPEVGDAGQRRLGAARVLVVGAGGLGCPALLYLAAAGVGRIGIAEFDVVDESNLQRQVLYTQADVGTSKAQVAREAVTRRNSAVEVVLHEFRLDASNAEKVIDGYDLVLDGSDNFATRYLLNDACVLAGKPYVWGSIHRFDGQASVFWPPHGPCYRCLYPEPPPPGSVPSCAEAGVLGILCASIGSIQVNEALKLILGIGEPLIGRLVLHDALSGTQRQVVARRDPQCAVCGDAPTVTELIDYEQFCGTAVTQAVAGLSVAELRTRLELRDRGDEEFALIDVREPAEHAIGAIPGDVLVPLGGIVDGSGWSDLPRDRPLVLYCRSGIRSGQALEILQAAGFSPVTHLSGGIQSWQRDATAGVG